MSNFSLAAVSPTPHWRGPLLALVAAIAAVLLAYWNTGAGMVEIWSRSQTFTHAFLVPPIVVWLIWLKRADLSFMIPRPAYSALGLLVCAALLWWLGDLVSVNAATHIALVAMVVFTVPLLLGWQVTGVIAFPLAFLFFAAPVGEFMEPTLMHWTAEALVAGLRLTGIPVHQEGQQLVIPTGRWEVVEACSGIRYLVATLMAGSLFAYLNYTSLRKRLVFAMVAIAVPLVANWLRAYFIVMLGHLSNNRIATGVDHLVYGWVFFGVVIMVLFYVGARYADDPAEASGVEGGPPSSAHGPIWSRLVPALLVAVLAMVWPQWLVRQHGTESPAPVSLKLPDALGQWSARDQAGLPWQPYFEGAASRASRVYAGAGAQDPVVVDAAYFRGQSRDAKLVSSVNRWLSPDLQGWNVLERGPVSVTVSGSGSSSWRSAVLLPPDSGMANRPRITAWRVYWVGGSWARSDVQAKLLQAWMAVRGRSADGVVLHVWTVAADDAEGKARLTRFVGENLTMIQRSFESAAATP